MRALASLAIGTVIVSAALAIEPSAAADRYIDPAPPGVASYTFEEYCREYSYRVRHPTCSRFYDDDSRYYNSGYYYYDDDGRRHERRHREHHRDRDDDRGDRYEDRDRGW